MSRGVFKELWKLSPDATRLIGTMRFETALTTAKALQIVNNIAVNNGHFPASIKVDYNRFEVQVEMFTIALGGISYNDLHMATMMEASLQLLEPMKEHHDQGSL